MARKASVSSAPVKPRAKSARLTPDRQIDFSDIPESTDRELARARRVGRPVTGHAEQFVGIRIDPKLLGELRKLASPQRKPHQTLVHELLEVAVRQAA